ncbi:hypothetical protein EOD14_21435 [Mesorhizobium sp. M7A.T.Ca.US.000.02.1.1]|uniref:DUF7146 domain-containing protein n=4 Tax=unclassified Mesorhizobium TaxID=325217 RepID=UPI000FD253CE|nr:toprim domain-containing protein [Mesorhizobium sp. M7A.T.Ca.US.000.02.1.1]RUT84259.1 hypothetical protein EOD14_21435 [Mesorhizobium sp. M7A.T.Ca.US.000.02.1.1]RUU83233.1 hypothetical protein EOD03_15595 [Mesorhizobium sp. M7A.T.Ca.TU.009.01.1.2]
MSGDLDIIKSGLIDRIEGVCERLLPDGKPEGGLWVAWNPVELDQKPGRLPALKVRIRGGDLGAWRCYRSGAKGDVLRLVEYVQRTDIKGALAWGRDFLGIRSMSPAERQNLRRAEVVRAKERDEKAERARLFKLQTADQLFFAKPSERETGPAYCPQGTFAYGTGTAAELHAKAYFRGRGVDLDQVQNLNRYSFRFSPATEWWKGARYDNANGRRWKAERGPLFPAMHCAMRNRMGIVTACHVTFFDPVRASKAPVTPAKLMWGEAQGAVVEISMGPNAVPFWMADRDGLVPDALVLAEGIETAASFCAPVPEARVWAGGSLAGVGSAPVGLDCVEWVLFARDNNTGNPQAQKQFDQALAGLEGHGKRVVVEASHVGDDFNDLAQGEE